MESRVKEHIVIDVLARMKCGVFSHDKKLFAAGSGKRLYLYDAYSFKETADPVKVIEGSDEFIWHLEFSSDDRYVFFGGLDFWFSVQEKCAWSSLVSSQETPCIITLARVFMIVVKTL